MAAYTLATNGLKALMLEKSRLPRYKVCGGGVVYRGRQLLSFDISAVIEREFYDIDWKLDEELHFSVKRDYPIITMVMRDSFDALLIEIASKAGAEIHDEEAFESFTITSEGMDIHTSHQQYKARYLIAADGVLSSVHRYSGLKDRRLKIPAVEAEVEPVNMDHPLFQRVLFDVTAIPRGYGWVFPKGHHLSVGVAAMPSSNTSLNKAYHQFLSSLNIEIADVKKYGFQIPLNPHRQLTYKNILFTGDAAGLADPLVAEGISNALLSGKLAGQALVQNQVDASVFYENSVKRELRDQIRSAGFLARLFYDHPGITKRIMHRKGQYITEYVSDIFAGNRRYPENISMVSRSLLKLL